MKEKHFSSLFMIAREKAFLQRNFSHFKIIDHLTTRAAISTERKTTHSKEIEL